MQAPFPADDHATAYPCCCSSMTPFPVPVLLMCPMYSSPSHPLLPSLLRKKKKNHFRHCKIHSPRSDREAPRQGKNQCIDDLQTFHGERKPALATALGRGQGGEQSRSGEGHSSMVAIASPPLPHATSCLNPTGYFWQAKKQRQKTKAPGKATAWAGEAAAGICSSCCRIY